MDTPQRLFLFVGKPASGKETQGRMLADVLGYRLFSTGVRFREIIASGSQLGERIKEDYEKGLLMPTWIADFMFQDFVFNLPPEEGAVFEGSGRDREQAEAVEKVCSWLGRPYTVFNLEVSDDTVALRSLGRGRDKGDSIDAVRTRLAEYERLTRPAIEYFQSIGKSITIDGEQSVEAIHKEVMAQVSALHTA